MVDRIKKLCGKTSFQKNDIEDIKNLYSQYINNRDRFCSHCPGSVAKMIKTFQANEQNMINRIEEENKTEEDGKGEE